MLHDFVVFVRENNVLGAAVAFVTGLATKSFVDSLVQNLIMPIVGLLLPGGDWQTMVIYLGTAEIGIGQLISAFINFIIILLVVYLIVKATTKKKK